MVPRRRLELPHLAVHGPEPCASTNSAIWAHVRRPEPGQLVLERAVTRALAGLCQLPLAAKSIAGALSPAGSALDSTVAPALEALQAICFAPFSFPEPCNGSLGQQTRHRVWRL